MKLMRIKNLCVDFDIDKKKPFRALDKVSFELEQGEALGIVGESGSGKSTLVRSILQLKTKTSGDVIWKDKIVESFNPKELLEYRKQIQMIFQDPLDALNPRMTVGQILEEPLGYLKPELDKSERNRLVRTMLVSMGLSEDQMFRYPHEFSGGQCQRIGIARAMIVAPELLICDEPVSALDVSIQAQIINLLLKLKQRKGLSMIFISHDLSIVQHLCDRVLVLRQGKVVEIASAKQLYQYPGNDYTKRLLASVPLHDPEKERKRIVGWK